MSPNQQVKLLRIVVASPGDVKAEREALSGIIEEINRGVAADRELRLELSRWETDTYPGFHADGPQGGIDRILKIEECDLLIGIFWRRFGTPVKDAASGTEHEFKLAYQTWQKKNRPQIMVYFNEKAYTPKSKEETDQWGKVLDFRSNFPKEGLWWPYKGKAEFVHLVRNHLTQYVRNLKPKTATVGETTGSEQKPVSPGQAPPVQPVTPPRPPTLSPAQELKKTTLQKQLATLLEQYQAVVNELEDETNAATKVLLEKKADKLLNQYDEKLTELEQLK